MKTHIMMHPRAEELLVERALRPLTDGELRELSDLGVDGDDSLELSAAALTVALTPVAEMPAGLAERLMQRAATPASGVDFRRTLPGVLPPEPIRSVSPPPAEPTADATIADVIPIDRARQASPAKRRLSPAWIAAAAGVAVAIGAGLWARDRAGTSTVATVPPAEGRAALLASGDAHALAWTATADPTAHGARGDVVWSTVQQRGYMTFLGLAANDPKEFQYQLWIFDRTRDQAFPVDGGVFDVASDGEVIVPIAAKLHVDDATLFAVTVERPGGVVVSKRERIVVTAKPS